MGDGTIGEGKMSDDEAPRDESSDDDGPVVAYNRCVSHAMQAMTRDNSANYPAAAFRACAPQEEELKKAWLGFFGDRLAKAHSPEEIEALWRSALADFRKDAVDQAFDDPFADETPEEPLTPGSGLPIEPPREDPT